MTDKIAAWAWLVLGVVILVGHELKIEFFLNQNYILFIACGICYIQFNILNNTKKD